MSEKISLDSSEVKNIFSQITFNFQRIAYKNTAKLNIKIHYCPKKLPHRFS